MKKKVKKIPKYNPGGIVAAGNINNPRLDKINTRLGVAPTTNVTGGSSFSGNLDAFGAAANIAPAIGSALGIEQGTVGQIGNMIGDVAMQFNPVVGTAVKLAASTAGTKGSVNWNTGTYEKPNGWVGALFGDEDKLKRDANLAQNSIQSKTQTQNLQANYHNENPTGSINVLAAEGGIMRRPVNALVSKGELIYDPTTLKLRQVPGSKGKPNRADDVYARLYEGDVVISNSPTMLMANGKTPAQNLMGMVDKYSTGGTVKAREAIIKKVVNWQEANKTKPQEYAMYSRGTDNVKPYGYNKNLEAFEYWDKDKKEYKKEYLDWVNNLTEQDVKDIFKGVYGDMSTYKGVNTNYIPTVEEARKLMTDKKYGDWHKIGKMFVDSKISNLNDSEYSIKPVSVNLNKLTGVKASDASDPLVNLEKDLMRPVVPKIEGKNYWGRALKRNLPKIGKAISDWGPALATLFGDYDYHTEQSQITPPKFVPVNTDPRPLLRAADESSSIGNYNIANMGVGTGAYMAHSALLASDRAKRYADAYQWQQETNNKLIAQNAGIYNDWRKQRDAYATQAIADTRANEGAAQQMRDSAIRDAYEFMAGRRNDRMRLAMMEPLAKYAFDDDTYKKIYSRAIV